VTGVIERFGVLGVFLLMVPESACVPVPSEVTLLFSGFAVGRGWLSFPVAVLAATAGNVLGSLLAYALGASGLPTRLPVARSLLDRWRPLIEAHGARAVFTARLLPLARSFVSLPAGANRVPLVRFLVLTTLGCLLWAVGFVLAGVLLGEGWAAVSSAAGHVLLVVGVAALVLSLAAGARHRRRQATERSRRPD
jgi:membrane protein DedA with SNARE-associated domain